MKKINLFIVLVALAVLNFGLSTFNCLAQTQKQLWGMTYNGGMDDSGVIFRTDGSGNNYTMEQTFWDVEGHPSGSLIHASDGKLYGMTYNGGTDSAGIIFQYDPATFLYTRKFNFDSILDGGFPTGSLMQAADGKLYGMTNTGGANGVGVIFQYDPATNTFTKKIDLSIANGCNPFGSLMQASDGMLYGMTHSGGANNVGVIFQYNPALNTYTKKIDLSIANGNHPYGSLMQALDGMLYGMTSQGGSTNEGVIFQYDASLNSYTKKIDLSAAIGASPDGDLIQTTAGILCGMTYAGGANSAGVLFEYDPASNIYSKKIDFDGTTKGSNPMGSLIQASDGKIYGMTTLGGINNLGVIFQYDPSNSAFTKKKDFEGTFGSSPHYTSLIEVNVSINTIVTNLVNCSGSSIRVPYTLTGGFDLGNTFTAQLSDASGNFSAAVTIGSLYNFANDTISCTIPLNTPTGAGYRIRVISSMPAVTGNINGSDITINALPTVTANTTANIVCAGNAITLTGGGASSYSWTGAVTDGVSFVPSATATYTVTGTDIHNCSNVATKVITVLPTSSSSQTHTFCAGQSLSIGTNTYSTSGTFQDTLTSFINGCDSIITLNLTILPANIFSQTFTKCHGQNVIVENHTYTSSGTFYDTLPSLVNGCDSTIVTHLTILPANTFSQTITTCAGQSLTVGASIYSTNGTFHDTLTSLVYGCDSMITTNLTVLPINQVFQSFTICQGNNITVGSHTHGLSGTYNDTLSSLVNGCDSIVNTHLSVDSVDINVSVSNGTLTANALPASYQWIDCNNGNSSIAGQTNQSFTANADGNYAVIITQNNCSDTSSCYNITGIGIAQLLIDTYHLSIYPNPFSINTTLTFAQEQKNISIKITDVLGKEVKTINFSGKQLIIEKGEMQPGIYFVQVMDGSLGSLSKRIVTNRKIIVQ